MECTHCHMYLSFDDFSYKNESKKIYYLHCNKCREKIKTNKARNKEHYEMTKKTNVINCSCGTQFIAFREYHILRHVNTKNHLAKFI